MRRMILVMSVLAGLNATMVGDRYFVASDLDAASDMELMNLVGGAASCKKTEWFGVCGQTSGTCNSGTPDPCVFEDPEDEESMLICVNTGEFQLLPGSAQTSYPSCEDVMEDGRDECIDRVFYCYKEEKCANDCSYWEFWIQGVHFDGWACDGSNLQRNAGRQDTDEANPASDACKYFPPS
ncbi:MAG: hypothetical protein R3C59_28860 [Planctomycetaceae bacterium]